MLGLWHKLDFWLMNKPKLCILCCMVWFYEFRSNNEEHEWLHAKKRHMWGVQMGSEDQNTITWSCQKSFDKQEYVHKASIAS